MKSVLFTAILASFAMLPTAAAASAPASPTTTVVVGDDEGTAKGTVVVWKNYHSGKPTAHLRGNLFDECGVLAYQIVARLEDCGDVTGYAYDGCEYYDLCGEWYFDPCDAEGCFEIEFENDDCEKVEVEGDWCGWRTYWCGEWETEYHDD